MFVSSIVFLALFMITPETRHEYEAALIRTSSDAAAQVRLALWCELHGLDAERKTHLELALKADPTHTTARGLLGLVEDGGRLARPREITERVQADPTLTHLLAQYETRRDATPDTAAGHWNLANWCDSVGLKAEAVGHYSAVTRIDPNHAKAWAKLGCEHYGNRWLTRTQIAHETIEAEAQRTADATWTARLATWKRWLRDDEHRQESLQQLGKVRDPRAVPAITRTFLKGTSWEQSHAVSMLAAIDAPEAAKALVGLAVSGRTTRVRRDATEGLLRHDPSHFVDDLIARFRDPIKYKSAKEVGPSSPGVLLVDRPTMVERRIYEPPAVQVGALTAVAGPNQVIVRRSNQPAIDQETRRTVAATETQLEGDVAKLVQHNAAINANNQEIDRVLAQVTGRQFGPNRITWAAWWVNQKGESYKLTSYSSAKPVVVNNVAILYVPPVIAPAFTLINLNVPARSHHSCFAAGTPVLTLRGMRLIETIEVGDLVLSQDVTTGMLGYEPVVASLKNPPAPTLRLELDRGESIITTGIHRFWSPGIGWRMARELKVGDRVRTLDGSSRLMAIEPQSVRPVFNLEVAHQASFFVGRHAVLVHDHSTVSPVSQPFDAVTD